MAGKRLLCVLLTGLFSVSLLFGENALLSVGFSIENDTIETGETRGRGKKTDEPRVAPMVDSSLLQFSETGGITRPEMPVMEEQASESGFVVDEIAAVIGTKKVKLSDVERSLESQRAGGMPVTENSRCEALESLMVSALYELQADEDSIQVGEAEVEQELEARLRYFIEQIGSREKLEEFYGKSILQIKEEYREMIRKGIVSMRMEAKITEDVKVTPSEVKRFYNTLDRDSIPFIPLKFELLYIVKKPVVSLDERQIARQRLEEIRARIVKGEQFKSLAALYSQDPGSARRGGDLGYGGRGDWTSEFESMAFSQPVGELSPVFESAFGFHILEVLDRKGEMVRVRHILIRPEASDMDLVRTQKELDSVAKLIRDGVYTFKEAVGLFSDEAGAQADGVYLSPMTHKPNYTAEELEPMVLLSIQNLQEGENTNALLFQTQDNQPAFRIFYVKRRISPHRADIQADYDMIYDMALQKAKSDAMRKWMTNKIANTYVRVMDRYKNCKFLYRWKNL